METGLNSENISAVNSACFQFRIVCVCYSEYVLDQLEAERKFLLFAHHQEMLDAVEDAVRAKVCSLSSLPTYKRPSVLCVDGDVKPYYTIPACETCNEQVL